MKTLISFLLVGCAMLGWGQSHMVVYSRDQQIGYATVSQSLQPDGSKVVQLRMELTGQNKKVTVKTESKFDGMGMPIRKFQETLVSGSPAKQLIATFDAQGAKLITIDGAQRKMKNVELVETGSRASKSELWFIRDKPIVGDVEKGYTFNLDNQTWELGTTEYKGRKQITVGKRKFDTHVVESERGGKTTTSYLDEEGLPIMIVYGDLKLTRIVK